MDREFDYKGIGRLLLGSAILLSLFTPFAPGLGPLLAWLVPLGAALCFFFALTCHISHVGQLQAKELLEIRKRLKAIETRFESEGPPSTND